MSDIFVNPYFDSQSNVSQSQLNATGQFLNNLINNISLTPGPTGATGPSGLQGPSGISGAGPSGLQGISGAMGTSGASGVQGLQGNIGPSGAQGLIGPSGLAAQTGLYYLNSNPSGYITGLNTGNFITSAQTGQFASSGNFTTLSGQVSNLNSISGSFITTGNSNYPKIQRIRTLTNSVGVYNFVYPINYASGVIPIGEVSVEVNSTDSWDQKFTYLNNTGCGILLQKGTVINILGINVVAFPVGAQAICHITIYDP